MANKIVVNGSEQLLKPIITQLMAIQQLMEGVTSENTGSGAELSTPKRKNKPQIILYFLEKKADVEKGYRPVPGEIKFRIMDKESDTLTQADVQALAERIKAKFAQPQLAWYKGKEMVSYTDWEKGYQLQILCRDKAVGRAIVGQVLDIRSHSLDSKNLNHTVTEGAMERYPTIPERVLILGESHKLERQRPMATVWFQYAELRLWGRLEPVTLVDLTGKRLKPVVAVDPIVA